jgi:hypothetical protein
MNLLQVSKPGSGNGLMAKSTVPIAVLSMLTFAAGTPPHGQDASAPTVPATIQVPEGNALKFHAYALGVQIYTWNGSAWVFQAPEAVLFASPEEEGVVGKHYAGPTWESKSGSKVVGVRVNGVTVDSSAIPWLLLRASSSQGPGVFNHVTYVQRLNTVGGIAPSTPGTSAGQVARVPYLAEYFFYEAAQE